MVPNIPHTLRDALSDLVSSWRDETLSAVGRNTPTLSTGRGRSKEEQALFDRKSEALALAKQTAHAREKAYNDAVAAGVDAGPRPLSFAATMTDYFIAAQHIGKKYNLPEDKWNANIIADLSGQTIQGFQINKADLEPSTEVRMYANIRAQQKAQAEGRTLTVTDRLNAIRDVQEMQMAGQRLPSIDAMADAYDLKGDQVIHAFYRCIDSQANFKGTVFEEVSFHPASTLMRNCRRDGENNVALTEGASFKNATFIGMGDDDELTLNKGEYTNISLQGINRGTVKVVGDARIFGMDVRGIEAKLHLEKGAFISDLDATGARFLELRAEGATISHAKFERTTIDMASKLAGFKLKDAEFNEVNLVDVNMKDAEVTQVHLKNTNVAGLSLNGARINKLYIDGDVKEMQLSRLSMKDADIKDLVINGTLIQTREQLAALGIVINDSTQITVSPELLQQAQKLRAEADAKAANDVQEHRAQQLGSPQRAIATQDAMNGVELARTGQIAIERTHQQDQTRQEEAARLQQSERQRQGFEQADSHEAQKAKQDGLQAAHLNQQKFEEKYGRHTGQAIEPHQLALQKEREELARNRQDELQIGRQPTSLSVAVSAVDMMVIPNQHNNKLVGLAAQASISSAIMGGVDVSLTEALSGQFNTAKDLVAKVQPEPISINMPGSTEA